MISLFIMQNAFRIDSMTQMMIFAILKYGNSCQLWTVPRYVATFIELEINFQLFIIFVITFKKRSTAVESHSSALQVIYIVDHFKFTLRTWL